MIRVELSKIIIDEKRQDQVIVLKEKGGDRQIPIVIGFMEASSIKIKVTGLEVPRPMTHDLMIQIIESLGAKIEIKNKEGELKLIDARPSDSIALAVRYKAPIFVAEEVLSKAAMNPQWRIFHSSKP